jgi:PIN domain
MPRIIKPAPRPHVMMPDTSVLWHEDKRHAVSPAFDEFWTAYASLVNLQLVVPEAVRQELLFQQTTSAYKKLDVVAEQFEAISGITSHPHRHRLQKDRLRTQVTAKIDKWLTAKGAIVQPVPYARINWPNLCEAAAWRLPPFTLNPKNLEWEKGFRDALILETIVDYAKTSSSDINIAFVCGDRLLRETVATRLKADARCSCYEALQDFSSYISLTREELTKEFIDAILRRARSKFFKKDDPSCLWTRDNLVEKLKSSTSAIVDNPNSADPSAYMNIFSTPVWEHRTRQFEYFIAGPQFQRVIDDADYYWRTTVTRLAEFHDTQTPSKALSSRILLIPVGVHWHARISADGRFRSLVYDSLEVEKASFRVPTAADVKRYSLSPETSESGAPNPQS